MAEETLGRGKEAPERYLRQDRMEGRVGELDVLIPQLEEERERLQRELQRRGEMLDRFQRHVGEKPTE